MSGAWRGRKLVVPDAGVRPTAERVREAWLSILAPELSSARVLDLFAGSGALGLEALSRGASHCTFVESAAASLAVLRKNVAALDASGQCTVQRGDALSFVAALEAGAFDIAVADPPFDSDLAQAVVDQWHVIPFARTLAVEHSPKRGINGGSTRRWGDIAVTFFRIP